MRRAGRFLLPCCILLALSACTDTHGPQSLTVSLDRHTETARLGCAVTRFEATVSGEHTQHPQWFSRDSTVAAVDWTGRVWVRGNGRTYIVATCEGAADSAEFLVDIQTPCLWRADLGELSSIALAPDGSLYAYNSSRQRFIALNSGGEIRWERTPDIFVDLVVVAPDGSVIVFGRLLSGDRALQAFSAEGDALWQYQGSRLSVPAVDLDGTVYVSRPVGNDSACVVSLAGGSGAERWRHCTALTYDTPYLDSLAVGPPVIAPAGVVFAGAAKGYSVCGLETCYEANFENILSAFSPEGVLLAQLHSLDSAYSIHGIAGPFRPWLSLAAGPDGAVYAAGFTSQSLHIAYDDGRMDSVAMDSSSAELKPGGIRIGPQGVAYTMGWGWGNTILVTMEPQSQTVRTFTYPIEPTYLPTWNGMAIDGDGVVFVAAGGPDGHHRMDALSRDGALVASYPLGRIPMESAGWSPIIGPDGTVYVQIQDEYASLVALPLASPAGLGTSAWPLPRADEANSGRVRTRSANP